MPKFQVGDRVRYAEDFLRRVQGHEVAPLRGTVAEVIPAVRKPGGMIPERLKVRWDDDPEGAYSGALAMNISKAR